MDWSTNSRPLCGPEAAVKVDHRLRELLAQRVFSIACYLEANDSTCLASVPIPKLLLDRGSGRRARPGLGTSPVAFREFCRSQELYRMVEVNVVRWHARRLRPRAYRVTIDLDSTHGAVRLSFLNWHNDTWCSLAVMGLVSFNDEAEQYLCAALLRSGNVTAAVGGVEFQRRLSRIHSWLLSGSDHSGSPGWWFCPSRGAGVSGCSDENWNM